MNDKELRNRLNAAFKKIDSAIQELSLMQGNVAQKMSDVMHDLSYAESEVAHQADQTARYAITVQENDGHFVVCFLEDGDVVGWDEGDTCAQALIRLGATLAGMK